MKSLFFRTCDGSRGWRVGFPFVLASWGLVGRIRAPVWGMCYEEGKGIGGLFCDLGGDSGS